MNNVFSQLVWLGANTALEPSGVLNKATHATLFEARDAACNLLQQKFPQKNVSVIQAALTTNKATVDFTEYNLAEFSAVKMATGLKTFFPGLKVIKSEQLPSTAINDAIGALALKDNNNLLIVDIADSNLALLQAIEQGKQLHLFRDIYIQTANEPLYADAATSLDINNFMQAHGYTAQPMTSTDPDLLWLSFSLNPLWATLQKTQQSNGSLQAELAQLTQKLNTAQQEAAASKQELQKQEARLNEINTALEAATKAKLNTEQQLATVKAEKDAALKLQNENTAKFSGDAQIDEVISDLSAFFTGKSITYVDVGAYTGEILEKIVASKKITVREAHLYEPNPESFKALKEKFADTKIKSLHTNNFAIGASEKQVTLLPAQSMTKIISSGDLSDIRQDVFLSDVKSLDSEIDKITERHIHLLKIDVEGYEMEVLRGAEKLLKNHSADVIYIEVGFNKNGTQQTYMGDIDNYLQGNGYRVFKIYEQKNEWIEDSPLLRRCNFAYMSASFAKANPFKLTMTIAELKRELTKLQTAEKNN